jgi:mannosyltransferase OCH1-like enzyme
MIPKILHHVHFGGMPDGDMQLWMMSARIHHPAWKYCCWSESNINILGLDYESLLFKCQNFASLSNIVRLHALNELGGVYLDTDIEVLKPMDKMLQHSANAAFQDDKYICNAIFSSEAGHPWLKWQLGKQDYLMNADAARGPYVMTDAPRERVNIVPTKILYPFHYDTPKEQRGIIPSESICIHHWSGSWQKKV